jgi:hypothetical protein
VTSAARIPVDLDADVSSMFALLVGRLEMPAKEVVAARLRPLVASLTTWDAGDDGREVRP